MVVDALHLDEGEAGFSCTRTGLFRVTKQAPNEARLAYRDHSSYCCHLLPQCDAGLSSLMHPCLFYDMPLSSLTHLMTASPLRVRHDSQVRRLQMRKELMAMI
jgi:hypothetical protein